MSSRALSGMVATTGKFVPGPARIFTSSVAYPRAASAVAGVASTMTAAARSRHPFNMAFLLIEYEMSI
jgi:hypothetical protein